MSEDVWSEANTNPDAIEAALREMLRERHAANQALAPARVLNLVVVVDRVWKGEVANRLERVGRYHASRTILCAVEDGRTTLDAVAVMSYAEPKGSGIGVMHEQVEIDMGPEHLRGLKTIVDPVVVSELPTVLWSPHGHDDAVDDLRGLVDVMLLDSDDPPDPDAALARAGRELEGAYVVDLAWLRTTPWRERLAASFDTPARRHALSTLTGFTVRHQSVSTASALLLAGWLSSRLNWNTGALGSANGAGYRGRVRTGDDREVEISLAPFEQDVPGLAGVTVTWGEGCQLSLDRAQGGLWATETSSAGEERSWLVLGAREGRAGSWGRASGRLCCGTPLTVRRCKWPKGSGGMPVDIEVVDDPGRECAAILVGVAAAGGHIVLTGGSTPRAAYGEFVEAVRTVGIDVTRCTMWFGDERCVDPGDQRSNYGMARAAMFDRLGADSRPAVHRMQGEMGPDRGADEYERELRDAGSPQFDLVLLGMGSDGHCASLFPDQSSLSERSRLVVGVEQAGLEPFVPRISMTLPALTNAKQVVFLATGDSKAAAVAAAFGPAASPTSHVPSSLVAAMAKDVKVLLDGAAAAKLGDGVSGAL